MKAVVLAYSAPSHTAFASVSEKSWGYQKYWEMKSCSSMCLFNTSFWTSYCLLRVFFLRVCNSYLQHMGQVLICLMPHLYVYIYVLVICVHGRVMAMVLSRKCSSITHKINKAMRVKWKAWFKKHKMSNTKYILKPDFKNSCKMLLNTKLPNIYYTWDRETVQIVPIFYMRQSHMISW